CRTRRSPTRSRSRSAPCARGSRAPVAASGSAWAIPRPPANRRSYSMSELDLVRDLHPDRALDPDARERVPAALAAPRFEREARRPRLRRRWLVPAFGVSCTVAAVSGILLLTGGSVTADAEAGRVLRAAAETARAEAPLQQLGSGQYLYTKSTNAYLNTW